MVAPVGIIYLVEGVVGMFLFPLCSGENSRFVLTGSDDNGIPVLSPPPPLGHHLWSHTLVGGKSVCLWLLGAGLRVLLTRLSRWSGVASTVLTVARAGHRMRDDGRTQGGGAVWLCSSVDGDLCKDRTLIYVLKMGQQKSSSATSEACACGVRRESTGPVRATDSPLEGLVRLPVLDVGASV